jgi:murein DD-endopeptidase MepM/ murein hydrolase activator NlpD
MSAMIFLAITLIKFTLPIPAEKLKEDLLPAMAKNIDYKTAMTELGGYLTSGKGGLPETPEPGSQSESPGETPSPTPYPTPSPTPEPSPSPSPEPTPEPAPDPTPEPTPSAVAAFMESQTEYADQAIPASVTYDMPVIGFEYVSPISGMTSDGFGYRMHPLQHVIKFHYGTDLAAWTGTDIAAFADGTVREAGEATGFGKYIIIDHADGFSTLYAHCSELLVSYGETVCKGGLIAKVGATGDVTGPHLHFELRKDGVYINPEYYINT